MQNELQTALCQAFDTLNLQRVKPFSVPPVTLCGPGAVSSCGQQAQTRGLKHLFVMADSFLHQAGMTAISANLRVEPSEECDASVPR